MKIFQKITKGFLALLVLFGIASSNSQQNMAALASSNNKRTKKTTKVAKKKRPGINGNGHSKAWQQKELAAKKWIVHVESRGEWNASNGKCFGRFQMLPRYLGYKNGHLNLDHKHQEKVADKYVHNRYGSWQKAKQFHIIHHWY